MKKVLSFLLIFFSFTGILHSQTKNLDSLAKVTETLEDHDTTKIYNYCDLAIAYGNNSELEKALEFIAKADRIIDKCNTKRLKASYYYIAGHIHYKKLNFKESLSNMLKAVKFYEEQSNKRKQASCYTIIGLIYQDQTFYDKAELFLKKSLDLRIQLEDSLRLSGEYSNLGLNYYKIAQRGKKHTYDSYEIKEAIKNLNTALLIAHRLKLTGVEASALGNLSNIMNDKGQFKDAEKYAKKALEIYRNMGDAYQEAISLIDLASIYIAQNKPKEAIPYIDQTLDISLKNDYEDLLRYSYINFVHAYERLADYKQAFIYQKKLIVLNDSMFNSENLKQINEMQIKYESEKKESENALLLVKNELSDKAIKNQRLVIFFIIGGLALALVFAFFIFKGLKKQKQANRIISQQKKDVEDKNILIHEQHELLEEKQKEIIDSINYAKRIQQAHLPTEKYFSKNLGRLKKKH